MRAFRRHPSVVAVTTALIVVAAVAGPVQAGPAAWLTSPTPSRTVIAAGGSVPITITNTDRRTASSALTVTLARNPSTAPFAIVSNLCAGVSLPPGGSCIVEVAYLGPTPNADHTAALTVASGKPMKASVTRFIEVGVTFADVCVARTGLADYGGTITVLGMTATVGDRCDWDSNLLTAEYNAAFEAMASECFDLGYPGMIGYTVTAETGWTAMGCVID